MRLIPVIGLAALAGSFGASAQEPAPVRETAEVTLVEVAVRVTGRDGQPVRDLPASAFTVLDDGRKQPIVGFDAIDLAEKVPGSEGSRLASAARRRFLILFDLSFARPKAVLAARRAARELVLRGLSDEDLCAVATYSVEKGLRILLMFSSDRSQLVRAIDTLGLEPGRERSDPLSFAYDPTLMKVPPTALSVGGGTGSLESSRTADVANLSDHMRALASFSRARDDDYERGRVRSLIQSFRDLGRTLDTVPGRKDIVYFSEGFRSRFVVGTEDTEEEKQWLLQGENWKVDSDKRFGSTPLRNEISEMGELLRRTDCVIHAIDIAGLDDGSDGTSVSVLARREAQESLYHLASPTGGEVFRNANDLTGQLDALMVKTSLVYVLAFRPDRSGQEGRFHELKVSVDAPGAKVAARKGYFERRGFKTLSPLERNLSAADVIANEIPVADLPARVLALPFAGEGGVATVPVLVEIPGAALLAGETQMRTGVEIYVYANDEHNRLTDFFTQSLGVDLSSGRERLQAGGLRYYGELALPPGDYRLRSLVRNADTGRMGLTVGSIRVPDFSKREPFLLKPIFLEAAGAWTTVRGRGAATGRPDGSDVLFAGLAGEKVVPSAMARLSPGAASRVCVVAYHFGAGEDADNFRIGSQLLASDGQPLPGGELEVIGKSPPEPDGKRVFLFTFTPPPGLAPGRYGLRIFLRDAGTGQARQAWTPFTVS